MFSTVPWDCRMFSTVSFSIVRVFSPRKSIFSMPADSMRLRAGVYAGVADRTLQPLGIQQGVVDQLVSAVEGLLELGHLL